MSDERVPCRTPNAAGVTNIPKWKFDALRSAILTIVDAGGPNGVPFSTLSGAVKEQLDPEVLGRLGSVGWHTTAVKLEMEVAGDIVRVPGVTPQRIVRA